jgi:flagellin
MGDTVSVAAYTLSGDQIISEDMYINAATGAGLTTSIASGSTLTAGFQASLAYTAGAASVATVITNSEISLTEATLSEDMTLKAGSTLQTGSKLIAGSTVGDATYVMGGTLNSSGQTLTTYQRTELKAGSILFSEASNQTVIAEGSTIGGNVTLNGAETLTSDMTLTAGSLLKSGTVLEQGTVINQDMSFSGVTGTVAAGTQLSQDMTLSADVTLTENMMALKDSVFAAESVISINTENAGTVGLSDTLSSKLSDLSVLTQEGAQLAIDIAESALEALDRTRAGLGSVQNQFTSTISNLSVTKTNIQASESAIRDVDFAEESMNFARLQLLSQTGSYALAQANASSQTIMSLLQ